MRTSPSPPPDTRPCCRWAPWLLLLASVLLGYGLYSALRNTESTATAAAPAPLPPSAPQQTSQPLPLPPPAPASAALQRDRAPLELGTLPSTSSMPPQPETPAASPPAATPAEASAAPSLPELAHSDNWWREQAGGLSPDPLYQVWLRNEHLLHKLALLVDNLSAGQLPARFRSGLPRLGVAFAALPVDGQLGHYQLDPAGYQRYRPWVNAFAALDEAAAVALYRRGKPLLQTAYAELGHNGQDFDNALIAAIDRLLAANPPSGPIELVRPSVMYKYADPALEQRTPLEKQLIRMGPDNAASLQNTLRRLRNALQTPPQP